MYAIKLRKTDLPLLTALNGGVAPEIPKISSYLILNSDGTVSTVTEKEFDEKLAGRVSLSGPILMKINKR